ncbi:MAG TPA: hypothetical protein VN673_18000, partial [Clostridia bacterium]|nr:hypothetical protein [Clostridia bacterium]
MKRASEQPRWLISTLSLLLAACTLLVYFQVRSHDFLRIDDTDYVVHNANVCTGLSADNVTWAFTRSHSSNWHPLTWISHMVDCELFGLNAGAHLLVNVGFHIGSTLFLFLVLRRLTNSIWRSLLVAGLFALHPLHVESVAWVAERKDVLSAFFFMLTLWAYTGYAQVKGRPQAARPAAARKAWLYYAAALLCFALGLMSKGMLVTLPFVLLLLDFWPLRRFQQGRVLPIVLEKMPFFVLTILCSVITFVVQQKSGAVVALEHVSLGERVSNAVVSYVEYLRLMIAPSGLSVFYPPKAVAGWEIGLSLALLVAVTAVGLKTWRSHPYILTGWFWYLGMLVPVIGIVKVGDQAYADRYTYLPSIGIFLLVAWAAGDLVTHWRSLRKPMAVAWVTVLCVLALLTHRQASYWKNTWLLYSHASEVTTNNFMAMMVMGTLLAEEGKTQEGRALIDAGLRIAPGHPDMNSGLGLMLLAEKKFAEAQPYFERALAKVPDLQQAQYGL